MTIFMQRLIFLDKKYNLTIMVYLLRSRIRTHRKTDSNEKNSDSSTECDPICRM